MSLVLDKQSVNGPLGTDPFELALSFSSRHGAHSDAAIQHALSLRKNDGALWLFERLTYAELDSVSSIFAMHLRKRYSSLQGSKEDLELLVEIAGISKGGSLRALAAMLAEKEVTVEDLCDANAEKKLLDEVQSLANLFGRALTPLTPGLLERFKNMILRSDEKATLDYFLSSSFDAAKDLRRETVENIIRNPRLLAQCQIELFLKPKGTLTASESDDRLLLLHQGLTSYIENYPHEALDIVFSGATFGLGREDFEHILVRDDFFSETLDTVANKFSDTAGIGSTVLAVIAAIEDSTYRPYVLPCAMRAAATNGKQSFIGRHLGRMLRDGRLTEEECKAVESPFLDLTGIDNFLRELQCSNFAAVASLDRHSTERLNLSGYMLKRAIATRFEQFECQATKRCPYPINDEEISNVTRKVIAKVQSDSSDQEIQTILSTRDENFQKIKKDKGYLNLKLDLFMALELGRVRGDRHGHLLQTLMRADGCDNITSLDHRERLGNYGTVMGYQDSFSVNNRFAIAMELFDVRDESRKLKSCLVRFAACQGIQSERIERYGSPLTAEWSERFIKNHMTSRDLPTVIDSLMALNENQWRLALPLIMNHGQATAAYLVPRLDTYDDVDKVTAIHLCVGGNADYVVPILKNIQGTLNKKPQTLLANACDEVLKSINSRENAPITDIDIKRMFPNIQELLGKNYLGIEAWSALGLKITEPVPVYPAGLLKALKKSCPNGNPVKRVHETHQLVLIPKGMSLKEFQMLTKNASDTTIERAFSDNYNNTHAVLSFTESHQTHTVLSLTESHQTVSESYWALLPRLYLSGSTRKNNAEQKAHLDQVNSDLTSKGYDGYEICSLLEHTARVILSYKKYGDQMFMMTWARCTHGDSPAEPLSLTGGHFNIHFGFMIIPDDSNHSTVGLGVRWRFSKNSM